MRRGRKVCWAMVAFGVLAGSSCARAVSDDDGVNRCQQVIDYMAECYPDLANEAMCTEGTIEQFDRYDLENRDCDEIADMGKADWFAIGGCGQGQRVCGWIFCCDDYTITWFPKNEQDWDIVPAIDAYQAAAPSWALAELERASWEQLREGVSVSFLQDVVEYPGLPSRELAVEITQLVTDTPYDEFVEKLPVADWGVELDHYLGGEVLVYDTDAHGRPTRQLERMVLSPFPCDWESPLSNNDMTKVEVIHYGDSWATVYWRVMYSNNNSTVTDVGIVDFWGIDDEHTLVTFHSAHQINAPGGIPIPGLWLAPSLESTFLDFVRHYRDLVE